MKFRTPPVVSSLTELIDGLDELNSMLDEMIYEVDVANKKMSHVHDLRHTQERILVNPIQ